MGRHLLTLSSLCALSVVALVHVFLFPVVPRAGPAPGRPPRGGGEVLGDVERSLCPPTWRAETPPPDEQRPPCPRDGIVTVTQGGRLGNQMWAYASVWAVGRRTGLEPFVPLCLRRALEAVFEGLSVPPLGAVARCPARWTGVAAAPDAWALLNQSILLPRFSALPELVLAWADDVRGEFRFRGRLLDAAGAALRRLPRAAAHYVGVHVRRTDYRDYLRRTRGLPLAGAAYFRGAMDHFRERLRGDVLFLVVSDDPGWCRRHLLRGRDDVFVLSGGGEPAGRDLAVMAACNHSVIDYGTFGVWGAILAGGEAVVYNVTGHSSVRVAHLLPGWTVMD